MNRVFLQNDLEYAKDNITEKECDSFPSDVKKTPLTNHHQFQMIILNAYNNHNKENEDGYSIGLRRK